MSRSSKGFADFFPTAPSVLQQKRSKTSTGRKRPRSPSEQDTSLSHPSPENHGSSSKDCDGRPQLNGISNPYLPADRSRHVVDEGESAHGDLLNGVGSASSTSTSSSVFSTNFPQGKAPQTGAYGSASLTPLTNAESSPPHNIVPSPRRQNVNNSSSVAKKALEPHDDPNLNCHRSPSGNLVPVTCQARPKKGEVKGVKIVYDPDLDGTKRSRKVQEVTFGAEVFMRPPPLYPFYFFFFFFFLGVGGGFEGVGRDGDFSLVFTAEC